MTAYLMPPAAAVVTGAAVVPSFFSPEILTAVGNGGVGVALLVFAWMFIGYMKTRDRETADTLSSIVEQFRENLSAIDQRHYEVEKEGRDAMRGLIDRHITITQNLAETLTSLKATVQANVEATVQNTRAIERLQAQRQQHHDHPGHTPDPDS